MLKKVNPYLKEEMTVAEAAHKCGCRCHSGSGTVGAVIQIALDYNGCAATCQGSANYTANFNEAINDKKW